MRLRADVVRATGATVHRLAKLVDGAVLPGEQLPVPVRLEIEESSSGGFFLYHYDAAGRCIADTWHATLVEAKEQAKFEFGTEAATWAEIAT